MLYRIHLDECINEFAAGTFWIAITQHDIMPLVLRVSDQRSSFFRPTENE